jgi:hypothetical protein
MKYCAASYSYTVYKGRGARSVFDEFLFRIAEEEIAKRGGEIQWFPVDKQECAGGVSVLHVLINGCSYKIPREACTSPKRFRRWLSGTIKGHGAHYRSATMNKQLTLDF